MTQYYRPFNENWQIMLPGPNGVLYPGQVFPTKEDLLRQYPEAVLQHPMPPLPPDLTETS